MTCTEIQNRIFEHCAGKRHVLVIPNHYYYYECDMISVNDRRFVFEFEVKISISDFRADAHKPKHADYRDCAQPLIRQRVPNYFYYVVPAELIKPVAKCLPTHAGLCVIEALRLREVIKAPRLHDTPVSEKKLLKIARGLMFRYWKARGARLF